MVLKMGMGMEKSSKDVLFPHIVRTDWMNEKIALGLSLLLLFPWFALAFWKKGKEWARARWGRWRRTTMALGPMEIFHHQVGGHKSTTAFKRWNGTILKPFQSKGRGLKEYEFYLGLSAKQTTLQTFIPKFHGVISMHRFPQEDVFMPPLQYFYKYDTTQSLPYQKSTLTTLYGLDFIQIEDLTEKHRTPCIMDVKMGTRTYDKFADAAKMEYERRKFVHQKQLGFRIQGIKVYNNETQQYIIYDKYYGRSLEVGEITGAFKAFLKSIHQPSRHIILSKFISRLEEMLSWFQKQRNYCFIASSLLFIYDAQPEIETVGDIYLIDFTHVEMNTNQLDHGFIRGLTNLLSYFTQLALVPQ